MLCTLCGRIVFGNDAFEFLIAIGGEPLDNLDFESQLVFEAILFQTRMHGLGCELGIDHFARQGFQPDPKTFSVLLNDLIFARVEDATNRELEDRWLKSARAGFGFDVEYVRVATLDRGDERHVVTASARFGRHGDDVSHFVADDGLHVVRKIREQHFRRAGHRGRVGRVRRPPRGWPNRRLRASRRSCDSRL